ncbi:MAG: type II toxin-antitoxin system RelE/ParE family toxin [Cyanobacteriota bacterium]|nr:type II toxin-antitoxin system RelE/ParE family toxin [Cyanobacteriota bacterium]
MSYRVIITETALAHYRQLDARWRTAVKKALSVHLTHQPTKVSKSRIKRLKGLDRPQYRLRVDKIRVFYDIADDLVIVLAILPKERAVEWLIANGSQIKSDNDEEN